MTHQTTIVIDLGPLSNLDSAERYAEAIRRATALGLAEGAEWASSGNVDPSNPLGSTRNCPVKAQWTGRRVLSFIRVVQFRRFHHAAARAAFAHAFDAAVVAHCCG